MGHFRGKWKQAFEVVLYPQVQFGKENIAMALSVWVFSTFSHIPKNKQIFFNEQILTISAIHAVVVSHLRLLRQQF